MGTKVEEALYEARAEVFRALAHPVRLKILECLADGEKCVCALQEAVGGSLPSISRHLTQMKAAGLVGCRRKGTRIFYSVLVPCVLDTLACIDAAIRAESERRAAVCARWGQ